MIENFKKFVKSNPNLINYVKNGNGTWQDLYEVYSLYGEDSKVWDKYINKESSNIDELIKMIQKVNLESVKTTIDSLQKAISILQSIGSHKENEEQYEKVRKYEDLDD